MNAERKTTIACLFAVFVVYANMVTVAVFAYICSAYSSVAVDTLKLIMTIPAITGMISSFSIGVLTKKIAKKHLLLFYLLCIVLYGAAFLFLGGRSSVTVLMIAAGLIGLARGGISPINQLIFANTLPQERLARVMGFNNGFANAGGMMYSFLGGMLAVRGWQMGYILAFLAVPAFFAVLVLLPKDSPVMVNSDKSNVAQPQLKEQLPTSVITACLLVGIFACLFYGYTLNVSNYIVAETQIGNSVQAGLAATILTGGSMLGGFLYGSVSKIFKRFTMPASMFLVTCGFVAAIIVSTSMVGIFIASCCIGFGFGVCTTCGSVFVSVNCPISKRPAAVSLYSGIINICTFFASYVLGFFGSLLGDSIRMQFVISAVGISIIAVMAFVVFSLKSNK